MNTFIDSEIGLKIDGYIAFYPDFPRQADYRYDSTLNPKNYRRLTGKYIKIGELLQEVYVWSDGTGWWGDGKKINEKPFPRYFPLKDLIHGKEGKCIKINVCGTTFTFLCAQQKSKNPCLFEDYFSTFEKYWAKRDLDEEDCTLEPFDYKKFKVVQKKIASSNRYEGCFLEKIFRHSIKKKTIYSNKDLKNRFKRLEYLGGGGEGAVTKVEESGKLKALKVSVSVQYDPEVISIINFVLDNFLSIHLTQVYDVIRVRGKKGIYPIFAKDKQEFIDDPQKTDPEQLKMGYVMELMDGDLTDPELKLTSLEEKAISIQQMSVIAILYSYQVYPNDCKYRNIFYKKLDETAVFKGKRLIDYDYWHYHIDEGDFYIPKMRFVIKLGDYDGWRSLFFSERMVEIQKSKDRYHALAALFPKPPKEDARILDMF